jgi:hypothetical protein
MLYVSISHDISARSQKRTPIQAYKRKDLQVTKEKSTLSSRPTLEVPRPSKCLDPRNASTLEAPVGTSPGRHNVGEMSARCRRDVGEMSARYPVGTNPGRHKSCRHCLARPVTCPIGRTGQATPPGHTVSGAAPAGGAGRSARAARARRAHSTHLERHDVTCKNVGRLSVLNHFSNPGHRSGRRRSRKRVRTSRASRAPELP